VALSLIGYGIVLGGPVSGSCCWENRTQMWGSALFGLISASLLFYLPVSGVHESIRKARDARLNELQSRIDATDRDDVVSLERLSAHRERIAHLSAWPVDVSILSRIGFYLIIPPLAWVGAALVETLVQSYLD
jgi:hypothetical protein